MPQSKLVFFAWQSAFYFASVFCVCFFLLRIRWLLSFLGVRGGGILPRNSRFLVILFLGILEFLKLEFLKLEFLKLKFPKIKTPFF